MPRIYVGIGSNIDRENSIRGALRELTARYGPLELSTVYESESQGFDGENFYNLVAGFESDNSVDGIKQTLSSIEDHFGRVRAENRFSARTLDLDLLLYGDVVDRETKLPHPDILRYAFVLGPLAEIAPDLPHPETGINYARMWQQFDKTREKIWAVRFEFQG